MTILNEDIRWVGISWKLMSQACSYSARRHGIDDDGDGDGDDDGDGKLS